MIENKNFNSQILNNIIKRINKLFNLSLKEWLDSKKLNVLEKFFNFSLGKWIEKKINTKNLINNSFNFNKFNFSSLNLNGKFNEDLKIGDYIRRGVFQIPILNSSISRNVEPPDPFKNLGYYGKFNSNILLDSSEWIDNSYDKSFIIPIERFGILNNNSLSMFFRYPILRIVQYYNILNPPFTSDYTTTINLKIKFLRNYVFNDGGTLKISEKTVQKDNILNNLGITLSASISSFRLFIITEIKLDSILNSLGFKDNKIDDKEEYFKIYNDYQQSSETFPRQPIVNLNDYKLDSQNKLKIHSNCIEVIIYLSESNTNNTLVGLLKNSTIKGSSVSLINRSSSNFWGQSGDVIFRVIYKDYGDDNQGS